MSRTGNSIWCVQTGRVFKSQTEAARWIKEEKNLKAKVESIQANISYNVSGNSKSQVKRYVSRITGKLVVKKFRRYVLQVHGYTFKEMI